MKRLVAVSICALTLVACKTHSTPEGPVQTKEQAAAIADKKCQLLFPSRKWRWQAKHYQNTWHLHALEDRDVFINIRAADGYADECQFASGHYEPGDVVQTSGDAVFIADETCHLRQPGGNWDWYSNREGDTWTLHAEPDVSIQIRAHDGHAGNCIFGPGRPIPGDVVQTKEQAMAIANRACSRKDHPATWNWTTSFRGGKWYLNVGPGMLIEIQASDGLAGECMLVMIH